MKLTYRGIPYTLHSLSISAVEDVDHITDQVPNSSPIFGKYRGAVIYLHQPKQQPQSQPSAKLQYRGAPYQPAPCRSIYSAPDMA